MEKLKSTQSFLSEMSLNLIYFVPLDDLLSLEELPSKVKNLVRSVKKVEAELVALKISYLKKINKGSNIVILDT